MHKSLDMQLYQFGKLNHNSRENQELKVDVYRMQQWKVAFDQIPTDNYCDSLKSADATHDSLELLDKVSSHWGYPFFGSSAI